VLAAVVPVVAGVVANLQVGSTERPPFGGKRRRERWIVEFLICYSSAIQYIDKDRMKSGFGCE